MWGHPLTLPLHAKTKTNLGYPRRRNPLEPLRAGSSKSRARMCHLSGCLRSNSLQHQEVVESCMARYPFAFQMPDLILPEPPERNGFNPKAKIPYGVKTEHIFAAMQDFIEFLTLIDTQLHRKGMPTLESVMQQASFSNLVSEMMVAGIPKHCSSIVKNRYHNGHPDMLPAGKYPDDEAQHAGVDGIEIKASRYLQGWQGHNAEDVWLMVFVFQSGRLGPRVKGTPAFKFLLVTGGLLSKADWLFSGRSETSRRTITASVSRAGTARMLENWIYKSKELREGEG
jgi:hypothetical protein